MLSSDGTEANGDLSQRSTFLSISADGRYVTFASTASNLVPGDTNGAQDVFLWDRDTGTTTRVSDGAGRSGVPVISADGRYVVYDSNLWDRETGTTTRVPVSGWNMDISADGRYIVSESSSSTLVPGDTNEESDVFLWDRNTGTTTRVSVATDGTQADASGVNGSVAPAISADGRWVTYLSEASNLVPGDVNRTWDVFMWDRDTGTTTRVSIAPDGTQANSRSSRATVSADGRWITYFSAASNLVAGDTNGRADVFLTRNPQLR